MLCRLWKRVFFIRDTYSKRIRDESEFQKHMLELDEIESDSEPEHVEGDALLLRRLDHLDWVLPLEDAWEARMDHLESVKHLEDLMGGLDLEKQRMQRLQDLMGDQDLMGRLLELPLRA